MNLELWDMPGQEFVGKCQNLYENACEANYETDDGTNLYEVVEEFANIALADNHVPTILDACPFRKDVLRAAVFSLVAPCIAQNSWIRDSIREELEKRCTKHQLLVAFEHFAGAANEFFRLLWIVTEHGGWRKTA